MYNAGTRRRTAAPQMIRILPRHPERRWGAGEPERVGAHANRTGTGAPVILQLRAPLVSEVDDWQARLPIDNGVDGAKTVTLLTQLPRDLVLFLPGPQFLTKRVYCTRTRTNVAPMP